MWAMLSSRQTRSRSRSMASISSGRLPRARRILHCGRCQTPKHHLDLIPATRAKLKNSGIPYVIENVVGAPLKNPIMLCGTMFNLGTDDGLAELWRHRLFESNVRLTAVRCCTHRAKGSVIGVYGGHGRNRRRVVITVTGHAGGGSRRDGTQGFPTAQRREALGIPWMTNAELSQSIPPAYSRFIGRQIKAQL